MTILSFDQASNISGWCFSIDGQIIDSGVIDKHKNKDIDSRICEMGLAICAKIKELQPSLVTFEDIQNQSSIKTVISLARLQGCIMLYCASKKISFHILHPTEWRKVLLYKQGKGVVREELKQQSVDYVNKTLGLTIESEDQCEAVCINVAAQKLFNKTK